VLAFAVTAMDDLFEARFFEIQLHRVEVVDEAVKMIIEQAADAFGGCPASMDSSRDGVMIGVQIGSTLEIKVGQQDARDTAGLQDPVEFTEDRVDARTVDVLEHVLCEDPAHEAVRERKGPL